MRPYVSNLRVRPLRLALAVLVTVGLAGCAEFSIRGGSAPALSTPPSAAVVERAGRLVERARDHDLRITPLVEEVARTYGVQLHGLSHRLKERDSMVRKIETEMRAEGLPAESVVIDDALRFRVLILDDPPGRYVDLAARILARLESMGFLVERLKNYWPSGDAYSGINCVMRDSDGFPWELQLHSVGSLAATLEGHDMYEVLRDPATPIRERRSLYDRLAERWKWVEIPEGALEPGAIHENEEIIERPRP